MITLPTLMARLQHALDLGLMVRIRRLVRRIRRLRRGQRRLMVLSTSSAIAIAVLLPIVLQYCGGSSDPNADVSQATADCAVNLLAAAVDPEDSSPDDVALVNQMLAQAVADDPSALTIAADGTVQATNSDASSSSSTGSGSSQGSNNQFVLLVDNDPESGTTASDDPSQAADPTVVGDSTSPFSSGLSANLVRVEEDWELVITEPASDLAAPQVGTVMTPFAEANEFYLAFALNYRANPTFAPGGMELQLWYMGEQLGWVNVGESVLSTPNEHVTWTQRLELQGNQLRFEVVDGSSDTWGVFGQGESLHFSVLTNLTDLNDYHPNVSATNSGITFASNRVASLTLKAVRGYGADGTLVVEDLNPLVVTTPPGE